MKNFGSLYWYSSYVTTSWGGDENRAGKIAKGKGGIYWLASLRRSHNCDMLLEGLCCPCPSTRKNGKKIGHGTSLTQNLRHPVTLRHIIYKGRHIRQRKAYCTHYLHTQTHTHPRRHTSSQRNYWRIKQTQYLAMVMWTMIPVHRGTATSVKPGRATEPQVTGTVLRPFSSREGG